jgi:hypothetical protein
MWRNLQRHEVIESGSEVNWLIDGPYGERLPAIDLTSNATYVRRPSDLDRDHGRSCLVLAPYGQMGPPDFRRAT